MKRKIVTLSWVFLLFFSGTTTAQPDKVKIKNSLSDLNTFFGTDLKLTYKGKQLVINFFKRGKRIREDVVRLEHLDANSVAYDEEQQRVTISCKATDKLDKKTAKALALGCIERYLHHTGKTRKANKISFDVGTATDKIERFKTKLAALVKLGAAVK